MLGELGDILGVTFRDDVAIDVLNLEHKEGRKKFRKEGDTLHLNLATLDSEERQEIEQFVQSQFEEKGRLLRFDEEEETKAMETGYDEDSDEILSYFDGVLSDRYHRILERALYLRAVIEEQNLSKDEIQEKKGQIARRFGSEAIYLSSLVSAGYFDPDGGLRDLYVEMGLNPEYDKFDFQHVLEEYVDKELLCVFVENDDAIYDVKQDVRNGLARYQREDPIQDWFDVRGIGDGCEEIINGVMDELEEEFIGIDYYRWKEDGEIWVRIHPHSLPPISQ